MKELRGDILSAEELEIEEELRGAIEGTNPTFPTTIPAMLEKVDDELVRRLILGAMKRYGDGLVALYSIAQVASASSSKRLLNTISEMAKERKSTAADEDEAFLLGELARYVAKRKERAEKR